MGMTCGMASTAGTVMVLLSELSRSGGAGCHRHILRIDPSAQPAAIVVGALMVPPAVEPTRAGSRSSPPRRCDDAVHPLHAGRHDVAAQHRGMLIVLVALLRW